MNADGKELAALLSQANVAAFLRMLRHGETSQAPDAYRMRFGGSLIDTLAKHPGGTVTIGRLTSSAAGAYQFLLRTWKECAQALDLPDFGVLSQDVAALFLIRRRGALADVLAGRVREAIAKCAREWASLPGAPYGQPTVSLAAALRVYAEYGGRMEPAAPVVAEAPAPVAPGDDSPPVITTTYPTGPAPTTAPPVVRPLDPYVMEGNMPIPAIIGALLPTVIELIPKLSTIFKPGSEIAERNVAAATAVLDVVTTATRAVNAQDAVEKMRADPEALAAATEAVQAQWFTLTEGGGGGIEGARKANLAAASVPIPLWVDRPFLISTVLFIFPLLFVVDFLFVHPEQYSGDLRVQVVTGLMLCLSVVAAYWLGTSFSSARKTEIAAERGAL